MKIAIDLDGVVFNSEMFFMTSGEIYDSMMTDLADAINAVNNKGYGSHEEKAQALALHVVNVLKNYGVTISQGIAEQVAPELLALHADQEADVSAAQVREMIERYAQ